MYNSHERDANDIDAGIAELVMRNRTNKKQIPRLLGLS